MLLPMFKQHNPLDPGVDYFHITAQPIMTCISSYVLPEQFAKDYKF